MNYESFVISKSNENLAYRRYHNTIYITHSSVRISLLVKVNEKKKKRKEKTKESGLTIFESQLQLLSKHLIMHA